jgi:hypothetical protein
LVADLAKEIRRPSSTYGHDAWLLVDGVRK